MSTTDASNGHKTSLYITTTQKQRLQELAQRTGFTIGRGSDSQLPAFLDHLMDAYPLALEGDDTEEVWDDFLIVLEQIVEVLNKRIEAWGSEIKSLLSRPAGKAYIEIVTEQHRIAPGAYARHEFGPAEFAAIGQGIVQVVEQLKGYEHRFDTAASANAFWDATVDMVQTASSILGLRNSIGADRINLPQFGIEDFASRVMDTGLSTPGVQNPITEQVQQDIAAFTRKLVPMHARAILVQAHFCERREQYSEAIALYEQAAETLRSHIPEYISKEPNAVERSSGLRFTSVGKEYMLSQHGLARSLARSGKLKRAVQVCKAAIRFQPVYSDDTQNLQITLMLESGDAHLEATLEKFLYYIDPGSGRRRQGDVTTIYLYTRAACLWRIEGDTRRAADALRRAFEHNPYVPTLFAIYATARIADIPQPDSFQIGSAEEAFLFADLALASWRTVPGLLDWLSSHGKAASAVKRAARVLRTY